MLHQRAERMFSLIEQLLADPLMAMAEPRRVAHTTIILTAHARLTSPDGGSKQDWVEVAGVTNFLEALIANTWTFTIGERVSSVDEGGVLAAAASAMTEIGEEAQRNGGRFAIPADSPGAAAIARAIDNYAELIAELPERGFIAVHRAVAAREREIRQGKAREGDFVFKGVVA